MTEQNSEQEPQIADLLISKSARKHGCANSETKPTASSWKFVVAMLAVVFLFMGQIRVNAEVPDQRFIGWWRLMRASADLKQHGLMLQSRRAAQAALRQAELISPESPFVVASLTQLIEMIPLTDREYATYLDREEELEKTWGDNFPGLGRIYYKRAQIYISESRWLEASNWLEKAIALEPGFSRDSGMDPLSGIAYLVFTYDMQNRTALKIAAIERYDSVMRQLKIRTPEARCQQIDYLVGVLDKNGKSIKDPRRRQQVYETELAVLQHFCSKEPDASLRGWCQAELGRVLLSLGRNAEAQKMLSAAQSTLNAAGSNRVVDKAELQMARLKCERGDFESALAILLPSIQRCDQSGSEYYPVGLHALAARCYVAKNEFEKAYDQLNLETKSQAAMNYSFGDHNTEDATYNLIDHAYKAGDKSVVERICRLAVVQVHNRGLEAFARETLAPLLMKRGKTKEAASLLSEAIEIQKTRIQDFSEPSKDRRNAFQSMQGDLQLLKQCR